MEYVFEPHGGRPVGVIVLSGRLDLLAAHDLKNRVQRLVLDGWTRLVIDLGGVPHVDSSGLGALIGGLKAARSAGGDLRVARLQDPVRVVLKASLLDRVLVPYASVDEALAEYAEPALALSGS